jgi:hypothetical protein
MLVALISAVPSASLALKVRSGLVARSGDAAPEDTLRAALEARADSGTGAPPATVRGVNIFYTTSGRMSILLVVNTVTSTFSELFGSSGSGRAIADSIGQHMVQSIHNNVVLGQDQASLILQAPTVINIIYDAVEQGTYTGTIVVDIDATGYAFMPNFYNDYVLQLVNALTAYFGETPGITVTSELVTSVI